MLTSSSSSSSEGEGEGGGEGAATPKDAPRVVEREGRGLTKPARRPRRTHSTESGRRRGSTGAGGGGEWVGTLSGAGRSPHLTSTTSFVNPSRERIGFSSPREGTDDGHAAGGSGGAGDGEGEGDGEGKWEGELGTSPPLVTVSAPKGRLAEEIAALTAAGGSAAAAAAAAAARPAPSLVTHRTQSAPAIDLLPVRAVRRNTTSPPPPVAIPSSILEDEEITPRSSLSGLSPPGLRNSPGHAGWGGGGMTVEDVAVHRAPATARASEAVPGRSPFRGKDMRSPEVVTRDPDEPGPLSLFGYIQSELTPAHRLQPGCSMDEKMRKIGQLERERVYNTLLYVPWQLERLLYYGLLLCFDGVLACITFVPLRMLRFFWKVATHPRGWRDTIDPVLGPSAVCDVLWVMLMVAGVVVTARQDISIIYHYIRGQEVIKLYMWFNLLEVFDRVCCSFGTDSLESLTQTASRFVLLSLGVDPKDAGSGGIGGAAAGAGAGGGAPPRGRVAESFSIACDFAIALAVVMLHSFILIVQATTINVAINSSNNALLSLLISNNFVEIKGNIFKKMDVHKLFELSCRDICERFHIVVLLVFVGMEMVMKSDDYSVMQHMLWHFALVLAIEVVVDILKHSFLGKFNEVKPGIYSEFLRDLCMQASAGQSHTTHRFVGFEPLAPTVVLIRSLVPLGKLGLRRFNRAAARDRVWMCAGGVVMYGALVVLKVMTGMLVRYIAGKYIRYYNKRHRPIPRGR